MPGHDVGVAAKALPPGMKVGKTIVKLKYIYIDSATIQSKLVCFNGTDMNLAFLKVKMEMLISVTFLFSITVLDVRSMKNLRRNTHLLFQCSVKWEIKLK